MRKLLDVLACPECKSSVKKKSMFILCNKCKLAFPILEGVPDMLMEDAWTLDKAKKSQFTHKMRL